MAMVCENLFDFFLFFSCSGLSMQSSCITEVDFSNIDIGVEVGVGIGVNGVRVDIGVGVISDGAVDMPTEYPRNATEITTIKWSFMMRKREKVYLHVSSVVLTYLKFQVSELSD